MSDLCRSRRACDRCHAIKERCRWISYLGICERCSRLNHVCATRRPVQKVGRKSRSTSLKILSQHRRRPPDPEVEKPSVEISTRDVELSSLCSPNSSVALSDLFHYDVPTTLPVLGPLDDVDQYLIHLCTSSRASVGRFTLGPSFHERHQRAFVTHLSAAMPQLKDALVSCAVVLANEQNIHLPEALQNLCHRRAATAVSSLRSSRVFYRHDVSICLILGVALTTFALYVAGGEAYTICRFTLNLVKPVYESAQVFDSDETSFLICLAFTEIVECLFRDEMPTLRFKPEDAVDVVDRYLGLSPPLLPHLYDLCELSCALFVATESEYPRIMESLDLLERKILRWQPTPPADFLQRYEQTEVINILAQVKVLRLTILLIVHRMRYPFGTEDEKARVMSDAIIEELKLAMRLTNQPLKCAHMSFVTACFELEDQNEFEMAINSIPYLMKYSDHVQKKIRMQLTSLWQAKEHCASIYWFNLNQWFSALPAGCIPPP